MQLRILALMAIAALAGWNQSLRAASSTQTQLQKLHLTDAQIEGVVRAKLAKSKMAGEGFTVRVRNRVATWEGKTNVIQHKGAATRMAKSAGATQVVNNIKITEEARRRAAEHLARYRTGNQPVKRAVVVQ